MNGLQLHISSSSSFFFFFFFFFFLLQDVWNWRCSGSAISLWTACCKKKSHPARRKKKMSDNLIKLGVWGGGDPRVGAVDASLLRGVLDIKKKRCAGAHSEDSLSLLDERGAAHTLFFSVALWNQVFGLRTFSKNRKQKLKKIRRKKIQHQWSLRENQQCWVGCKVNNYVLMYYI